MKKKVLLIGGGGTIGTAVAEELLKKGCCVDIMCLENHVSDNENLRYIKTAVTAEYLRGFLVDKYYDAVMNLIHFPDPEDYLAMHKVIAPKTGHEIVVSSIRALGDAQHPITSSAPTLLDLYERGDFPDEEFIKRDTYSMSKGVIERYFKFATRYKNWTIIRPMITTSDKRLDIVQYTFDEPVSWARENKTMYIPNIVRDNYAGVEWAGNAGKMVANIMFNEKAMCKTVMLSTGHRLTWGDVANIYTELLGLKVEWLDSDEYKAKLGMYKWPLKYDRGYNREVDPQEMLDITGLKPEDFKTLKEGITIELKKLGVLDENNERTF